MALAVHVTSSVLMYFAMASLSTETFCIFRMPSRSLRSAAAVNCQSVGEQIFGRRNALPSHDMPLDAIVVDLCEFVLVWERIDGV